MLHSLTSGPWGTLLAYIAACYGLAQFGGWTRASIRYSAPLFLSVKRRYFRCGGVGCVGFNGPLVTGATRNGLYLGILFPFRPGHGPLLISWNALSVKSRKVYWTQLGTDGGPSVTLTNREFQGLLAEAEIAGASVEHLRSEG